MMSMLFPPQLDDTSYIHQDQDCYYYYYECLIMSIVTRDWAEPASAAQ